MIERGTGDIIVTSSVAGPFSGAVGAGLFGVEMGHDLLRADHAPPALQARHPRRLGIARARHQRAARRLARREPAQGEGGGGLIEPKEVADAVIFMLTRPRNVTIRDVVILPSAFDI